MAKTGSNEVMIQSLAPARTRAGARGRVGTVRSIKRRLRANVARLTAQYLLQTGRLTAQCVPQAEQVITKVPALTLRIVLSRGVLGVSARVCVCVRAFAIFVLDECFLDNVQAAGPGARPFPPPRP